jgi:plastocyanin domain-containing protein
MRTNEKHLVVGLLVALAVIAAIVWWAVLRHGEQQACVDRGGAIHEYNCSKDGCSSWQCIERHP